MSRIDRHQILQAARRFYEHGDAQKDIAHDLGISPSYLARLLKSAKEDGWIRIYIDTDRDTALAAELQSCYPLLTHVTVVPSGSQPIDTARSLGTAAATFLNDLLDKDASLPHPRISNLVIGGGMMHREMVDRIVPRTNRISVGPTALTPALGQMSRFTAPTLATLLALKLGALTAGEPRQASTERKGYLYHFSVDPPRTGLSHLKRWYEQLITRPEYLTLLGFWQRVDLAFVSAIDITWPYSDVAQRLAELQLSLDDMLQRGAEVLLANTFLDAQGNLVPLAPGVPSYEPTISPEILRHIVERDETTHEARGHVVLDAWGAPGKAACPLLKSGLVNVLFCDQLAAEHFIEKAR